MNTIWITPIDCRPNCGACCIAPSISSPIPGMPEGKPAGVRCVQLDDQMRCKIFNDPARPTVCHDLQPSTEFCGESREQALSWWGYMEENTKQD